MLRNLVYIIGGNRENLLEFKQHHIILTGDKRYQMNKSNMRVSKKENEKSYWQVETHQRDTGRTTIRHDRGTNLRTICSF